MEIKVPKSERSWTVYLNTNGEPILILTSKPARDFYFLNEVRPDGILQRLGKARNPIELEDKFDVWSRMNA